MYIYTYITHNNIHNNKHIQTYITKQRQNKANTTTQIKHKQQQHNATQHTSKTKTKANTQTTK